MSVISKRLLPCLIASLTAGTLVTQVHGAGFMLVESSADLIGTSMAGAAAKATDASTAFYNPAGMTRLAGTQINTSATVISPRLKFHNHGSTIPLRGATNGGTATSPKVVPAFFVTSKLNDWTTVGLAFNTPFGLKTDYDANFVGRWAARKSDLKVFSLMPTVAFKVAEWGEGGGLSLGGGVYIQRAEADLTQNLPPIPGTPLTNGFYQLKGKDKSIWGYDLGILLEFNEHTRVGLNYRSQAKVKLKGNATGYVQQGGSQVPFPPLNSTPAEARVTLPATLELGVYHDINEQWAILGKAAWTNWKKFDSIRLSNRATGGPLQPKSEIRENWKNTYFLSLGTVFRPDEQFAYKFGVGYDSSPVTDSTRNARLPDNKRIWTSIGMDWHVNQSLTLTGGYAHLFTSDMDINERVVDGQPMRLKGKYKASVDIFSIGLDYKF